MKCLPVRLGMIALPAVLLAACDQDMANQPKYETYERAEAWPDDQAARDPVAGTVALDEPVDPSVPETLPMPLTRKLLEHGQERFNVFCSPCHGRTGYGNGMVVQRGFPSPPSFHIERLREAPLRHFYAVITDGFGVMYSYADRVPLEERWAIAAYIQALQLSQYAEVDDLTPRLMAKLGEAPPAVTREAGTVTHEPSLDDGTARGESRITPKAPAGEASQ